MDNKEQKEESLGKKYDKNKPSLELLPPSYWIVSGHTLSYEVSNWYFYRKSLPITTRFDAVPILEYGVRKYGLHNWHRGMRWGRIVGAFHRHCNYYNENLGLWVKRDLGELDEETNAPHGQHAQCCLLFLREYYSQWIENNVLIGENDCPWNK